MKKAPNRIPNRSLQGLLPLLGVLLLPSIGLAQERNHVFTIEDGKVFVDGRQVPEKDLPESLKINNRNLQWSFQGDALLELNGTVYQLQDGTLVEADETVARDGRMVVFFRDPDDEDSMVRVLSRNQHNLFFEEADEPYGFVMKDYLDALNNKAKEFEIIREQITEQNGAHNYALAEQLQLQAENAARIAKAFPRVEFESYMQGIHEQNLELYGELVRERDIESRTHQLAMEARATGDLEARRKIIEELRRELGEAFELKQQNREQEIAELAGRLDELRQKLDQRADLRDRIIESRLRELLGELDW